MKKECKYCKNLFYVKPCRMDIKKFCCKSCYIEYHRKITPCKICGKKFSQMLCGKKRFCSINCVGKYNSRRLENKTNIVCIECNQEFEIVPSRLGKANFCSRDCLRKRPKPVGVEANNWQGGEIDKICLECNDIFPIRKHRKNTANFCSRKCMHIYLKKYSKGIHNSWNRGLTKETDDRILRYSKIMKETRKRIVVPIKDTSIEVKIQKFLKELGIEFFTHQYMKIEHGYQCDILIPSINLVIECDGDYWHKYPVGNEIDHIRTSELLKKGFKVLRLWEHEIRSMKVDEFKKRLNQYEN